VTPGTGEWGTLLDDLTAEWAELDEWLEDADPGRATPAEGWSIGDQVSHLAFFDDREYEAITDPDGFRASLAALLSNGDLTALERDHLARGRSMGPAELRKWLAHSRRRMVDAFRTVGPATRLPWYGPDMSARSGATARLMETWAHAQDVADALGVTRVPSLRLRHVAHLGVVTFGWSHVNRGETPPDRAPTVELVSPDGGTWEWNPDGDGAVRGSALDFCLLVTQRRNRRELDLVAEGTTADHWLDIAQAFAGPATEGRS